MARPLTVSAMVLWVLVRALQAAAQEHASPAAAGDQALPDLERAAREAEQNDDLERAHALWLQAFSQQASAHTALHLGQLELELKRYRDSAEHLDYAIRLLPDADGEAPKNTAKKALAVAKAQIAVVVATTNRAGAEMRVNGRSVGKAPLAGNLYLDPGPHDISAHWENDSITRPIAVLAGQEYRLSLPLVVPRPRSVMRRPAPVALRDAHAATAPAVSVHDSSHSPWPLLVGGSLVVAGVASGVVLRLDSSAQYDQAAELRARRAGTGCFGELSQSDECAALRAATESGDRSHNWSTVGFVAAGTALLGTLTYWYWPWKGTERRPPAQVRFAPVVSSGSSGLLLRAEY